MRTLLLALVAVSLTGCATRLTLISPPLPAELLARCDEKIADPLTTADQYDLARALAQTVTFAKACKARQDALVSAVEIRQSVVDSIKKQLEAGK